MNFEISHKSTEAYMNWNDARLYCFSLGEGWRMPTVQELCEIYYIENNDFTKETYWSSTVGSDPDNYAETFAFHKGFERRSDKHWTELVRAVRTVD